jgi:hypothetical protein
MAATVPEPADRTSPLRRLRRTAVSPPHPHELSKPPPRIADVSASVENGELSVRWRTTASNVHPLVRALQWSADEGRDWRALAVKLGEDSAVVPVEGLRSARILVRVIVSDGFNTTESEPVSVDIPRYAPTAAILWSRDGATVFSGRPVNPEDMHWVVDGQRVGSGADLWAALQDCDGNHEALLTVRDGELSTTARVVFASKQV